MDLLARQLAEVQRRFPEARFETTPDGQRILVVPDVPVGPGWTRPTATIRIVVPAGYPHVGLDCLYVESDLRLASGAEPVNSSIQGVFGAEYRWFSWHVATWDPTGASLDRYVRLCEARFKEAR
jgi:hypothetical protein